MPLPSKRDPEQLRAALEAWFTSTLGHPASVTDVSVPEGTGMSSETLLFTLHHADTSEQLVARLRPDMNDWPVFEVYDLGKQAAAMRLVAAHSDVPVPDVPWVEDEAEHLGAPFIVMAYLEGETLADRLYKTGRLDEKNAVATLRPIIDALRGVAIISMVAFHATWDLYFFGYSTLDVTQDPRGRWASHLIAGTFLTDRKSTRLNSSH